MRVVCRIWRGPSTPFAIQLANYDYDHDQSTTPTRFSHTHTSGPNKPTSIPNPSSRNWNSGAEFARTPIEFCPITQLIFLRKWGGVVVDFGVISIGEERRKRNSEESRWFSLGLRLRSGTWRATSICTRPSDGIASFVMLIFSTGMFFLFLSSVFFFFLSLSFP